VYRSLAPGSGGLPGRPAETTLIEFRAMGRPRDARGHVPRSRWRRVGTVRSRMAVGLVAVTALGGVSVSAARADGDPASDALISSNVFYPYSSPVPQTAQSALNRAVAQAHRDGVPLKVAIIARASDLGSITAFYGLPQRYAEFLDIEISFTRPQPLLVVMADGDGVDGLTADERRAVGASSRASGDSGSDLAAAALSAVRRVDDELGASQANAGADGQFSPVLLPALVLGAGLAAAMLVVVRAVFPERPEPRSASHSPGGTT
jgi:hypothetical protein